MSCGINLEEQKRQQQYMTMQAQQKLEQRQTMDYSTKRKKQQNTKDMVVTICVVLGLLLALILFGGR